MKKFLLLVVLLMTSTGLFAQNDVTQFLGIPVDGPKSRMIRKLKAKGFVSLPTDREMLQGEFNGTSVLVQFVTNKDKVCRVVVADVILLNEANIRIRFNRLCQQFENNSKYTSVDDFTIPKEENIRYEMQVHDKKYKAVFHQQGSENKPVWFKIVENYGKYSIVIYYDNVLNQANGQDL